MKPGVVCACACVLLLGVPLAVSAQAVSPADEIDLIHSLLARIDKLEQRVSELENRRATATPPPVAPAAPAEAQAAPPAERAHTHDQPAQSAETQPTYPALKITGFSDFGFAGTDQRGTRSGFSEGQFILHLSSALSPKVSVFGEISFSARQDAGTGTPPATGFNAEVERSFVRFDQSDHFKVSFGRYHTPINYWNTAFHHGQWLQTTISRPEMAQFGGRFIPVHFVGGVVEGVLPARGLNLNYSFGLGNGRGSVISRDGDAGDNNNHRAWLINLFVKPDRLFGLQAGGAVYRDKISLATGGEFRELITSGHLVWLKETPEFIAEVANVHHREVGGSSAFNSQAFYVQLAYRLPWFRNLWKPYYRFEYIHIPKADLVFQEVPDLTGSTFGIRYDITSFAALKAEFRTLRRQAGQPRVNGGFLQTSFTF